MKHQALAPRLRVVQGEGRLPVWQPADDVVEQAIPLAKQLALMADVVGPASREIADELIALLESPRRPRRVA